jgi:hypothetical protein
MRVDFGQYVLWFYDLIRRHFYRFGAFVNDKPSCHTVSKFDNLSQRVKCAACFNALKIL